MLDSNTRTCIEPAQVSTTRREFMLERGLARFWSLKPCQVQYAILIELACVGPCQDTNVRLPKYYASMSPGSQRETFFTGSREKGHHRLDNFPCLQLALIRMPIFL
jgi:hypothetical protein